MNQTNPEIKTIDESHEQLIVRINSEVADFFEIDMIEPEVVVYDSKKDLHEAWIKAGDHKITEAPDWLVAYATYGKDIHILSPEAMPPQGKEMDGPMRFKQTVKHEITHLYQNLINKNTPSWLKEGVSLFVAKQDFYKEMRHDELSVDLLKELEHAMTDGRIYRVGINMVNQIVACYGKEKLFEIMAIKDRNDRYIELEKMFDWLV